MFQPWRALTTILNLCLTGKTSGFKRPRAPVLQILLGIVTQSNIDYAERIWEEFAQSIHTFMEDKWNLSWHTTGKKRATLILIPSIHFTKLIIHHLQGGINYTHDLTLHSTCLMTSLFLVISSSVQKANVAKHRGFLASETGSAQDSPAPKPAKPVRKPKSTAQKAPPMPSVSTPATETTDKPAKAKRIKHSAAHKTRKPRSFPKSVGTSEAEEVPAVEPQVADEDADYQKAMEESMKTAYALPRGKGKAKVTEEQVAHDLLSLQKAKKKNPMEQYIFQRRIFEPAGSSLHDKSPYVVLGQSDSEEESEKVLIGDTEGGNDEDQARPDPGAQDEGQTRKDANALDEGQAGLNPNEMSEGQAGPDPGNTGNEEQSIPSHVVHTGSDREHMDLDGADVSPQPSTEQLDEGFIATAYPKIKESLKLAVEEQVLLEEPASSSGTLSSLQHLSRDINFGDQFFSDKPSAADKNAKTKVESMVNVPIQQAMSLISISPMTSPIIDLSSRPVSPKVHQQFKATTTDTTTTTVPKPQAQQQSTTEAMMVKRIGELEHIMANLIQVNKDMEESEVVTNAVDWAMQAPLRNRFRDLPEADMKEILHQRMWETKSYKTHEDHSLLFEALEKSMNRDHSEELAQDLAEARKKKKKRRELPKTPPGTPPHQPPPSPPPTGPSEPSGAPGASGSSQGPPPPPPPLSTSQDSPSKGSAAPSPSKTAASTEYQAWTTPDVTLRPFISLTPADLEMDEDMEERIATPEPAWSIPSSDAPVTQNNWASALASDYSPPPEDSLLAQTGDMATFIDWFCKRRECHKLLTDSVDDSIQRNNISKPLPLGGPHGQVTIQSDFFFNKDLEYLRYGSKGNRHALSISKMKAPYYPDAGLEQMVLDQFWIDEECKYDIAAMYGISHWCFQRQRFYIDRHTSEGHLNHLPPKDKKILSTTVNQWIRQLVIRQRVEDFQLGIESYQTQLNLTKPQWDATNFEYKHDYTVIDSPRVVIFRDKYRVQMMMRFNEIHKFNDGTLQQIDEALDYRVKEFRINRMNPGLNTRFLTRKDVDRCNAFMFAIQRRLRTRRIFRNLESFVSRRVREGDYRLLKRTE
nr:hypothetical protein [Tanacetum cinerariifolium]